MNVQKVCIWDKRLIGTAFYKSIIVDSATVVANQLCYCYYSSYLSFIYFINTLSL